MIKCEVVCLGVTSKEIKLVSKKDPTRPAAVRQEVRVSVWDDVKKSAGTLRFLLNEPIAVPDVPMGTKVVLVLGLRRGQWEDGLGCDSIEFPAPPAVDFRGAARPEPAASAVKGPGPK